MLHLGMGLRNPGVLFRRKTTLLQDFALLLTRLVDLRRFAVDNLSTRMALDLPRLTGVSSTRVVSTTTATTATTCTPGTRSTPVRVASHANWWVRPTPVRTTTSSSRRRP